ncbi:hypothetical protein D7V72_04725 [bacterium D16-36]|nr:hypothetical protein D7V72_04725 [bacterium D16-36]
MPPLAVQNNIVVFILCAVQKILCRKILQIICNLKREIWCNIDRGTCSLYYLYGPPGAAGGGFLWRKDAEN